MSDGLRGMPELDVCGPAPGYALAIAKCFRWPRFHLRPEAVRKLSDLGAGSFGSVCPSSPAAGSPGASTASLMLCVAR